MTKSQEIRHALRLAPKRMEHTEGVVLAARRLAERHFPFLNAEEVEWASLLHDCTKEYRPEQHMALLAEYGETATEAERISPKLLHARTGALLAEKIFCMPDHVVSAIRWHTTGRENMTPLECVLYLADYIEENRTFPGCVALRRFYEETYAVSPDTALTETLVRSFDMTIVDLIEEGQPVDLHTVQARNYYLILKKGNEHHE